MVAAFAKRRVLSRFYRALENSDLNQAITEAKYYLDIPTLPKEYAIYLERVYADLHLQTGQYLKSKELYEAALLRDKSVSWAEYGL